jgi:hypothetical protein
MARAQVLETLGRSAGLGRAPRVWCWGDLWRCVGEGRDGGPARLSDPAARAALALAVGRARDAGQLTATADLADRPGFRRRVRDRVAGWTRLELSPDREPPPGAGPTAVDEWAIYGQYRAILSALRAEDAEGFARWASKALSGSPPPALRKLGTVTVVDPDDDPPAVRRALEFFEAKADAVRVTLAYDPEPMLAEVYSAVGPIRSRLIERGYEERVYAPDAGRPPFLHRAERELFRRDAHSLPLIDDPAGLTLLGAPQGDGVGLVVARELRRLLGRGGVGPEDVLVLVRSWDEHAEAVLGVLRSWGLPVSPLGRPSRMSSEPAVSALRMVLRLQSRGWEAAELVRLLRHGRFRPRWAVGLPPDALAQAAAAVRDSGAYRDPTAILRALDGSVARSADDVRALERARRVRDLVERLIGDVETLSRSGSWREHADRLRDVAGMLGIDGEGDHALERLWDALDDHAAVIEAADRRGRAVPFAAFVKAVEDLAGDHRELVADVAPGTVCMATVDQSAGARARFVILANLAEGTFPTRDAVESADGIDDPAHVGRPFAREMARFLRVLGSADEAVVLAYPTSDEKGQQVLPAGFLDDLIRRIDPGAIEAVRTEAKRFDPALLSHPDLAGSPADARARAVALACARHEPGDLARLAADPRHRRVLDGTAAALSLTAQRLGRGAFNAYDGRLTDPAVARLLAPRFGPEAPFSPSQLESYLSCPFQFFLKYVLKLLPVDDRDELDEDFIARGNRVHKVLEEYERLRGLPDGNLLVIDEFVTRTLMSVELSDDSGSNPGLHEIGRRQVAETLRRYFEQAADYSRNHPEPPARPALFEVVFGDEREEQGHSCVVLGEGPGAVRVQGKIDRVDVLATDQGPGFRVIDYKTGSPPANKDVLGFLMVQLPLYALAVERLALAGEAAAPRDVGYWDLRKEGFKKIDLKDWPGSKADLEAVVLDAVARLRGGRFVVAPKKDDCTQTCDYATVCRIGQVRGLASRRGASRNEREPG